MLRKDTEGNVQSSALKFNPIPYKPPKMERFGNGIRNLFHSNSRHDEPHEQAHDKLLEQIRAGHRFDSFAKVREENHVKWYVDGHDTFYAVSELLESAKHAIFIQDWWLTPELYLRRPPALNERWRLDRILKRKAEAGVKIYVIVYKEVELNMTMKSSHTKHALEALHPNIACMRHPDHLDGEETTLFWSHHQKVIVVDNTWACIGGLDLCFGRWDTSSHSLADCHISDFTETVWPGQDYNNARVQDFQNVEEWTSNQESRLEVPRMPWHDTHMMLEGPAVADVYQHFVERWNFIYNLKYSKKAYTDGRYGLLGFAVDIGTGYPDQTDHPNHEPVTRHPNYEKWTRAGRRFLGMNIPQETRAYPSDESQIQTERTPFKGNMRVQVVRSCGDWSNGTTTEHSIMNAYIQLIEESERFIYIENQFFITTCASEGHVKNTVGLALAKRIVKAAQAGQKFKIVVAIPCIPGFAGNLNNPSESSGTLAIMDWTYKSICRGENSIFNYVQKAGFDAREYISFYNLRNFDRINNDPATLKDIQSRTGISYYMTQAALARIYLGENASKEELEQNKVVKFKLAQEGEGINPLHDDMKACGGKTIEVKLPGLKEAHDQLRAWSQAAPGYDRQVADSVVTQNVPGGLESLPWLGDEESERAAYVSEELYIHTKLMIVDDKKVIMGSANINDRSMLGDRDSEIALVVEDLETLDSQMDGEYWPAARFAATLRRRLYKEHLGLLQPCSSLLQRADPTRSMLPVNVPQEDTTGTEADNAVCDPMGYELECLWTKTAQTNTESFGNVFRPVPASGILTWKDYDDYVPTGKGAAKVCHVVNEAGSLEDVKNQLNRVRGHLVQMPLDFLEKDEMYEQSASVNPLTMAIYT